MKLRNGWEQWPDQFDTARSRWEEVRLHWPISEWFENPDRRVAPERLAVVVAQRLGYRTDELGDMAVDTMCALVPYIGVLLESTDPMPGADLSDDVRAIVERLPAAAALEVSLDLGLGRAGITGVKRVGDVGSAMRDLLVRDLTHRTIDLRLRDGKATKRGPDRAEVRRQRHASGPLGIR